MDMNTAQNTSRPAIAAEVRAAAARQGVTGNALASRVGISSTAMHKRLRAEVSFTADEIVAIAVALNINPASLLVPHDSEVKAA